MSYTWDERNRALASIATEMTGAAKHLREHPDYATDAVVAATFRKYAERMDALLDEVLA